jgi:DNA-binding response OmpR family regulator
MDATILVVDDENDVLAFVIPTLERAGYQTVITANDGDEALRKYAIEKPDLIVLDIQMPGRSGYEVLREIRRKDKSIPIIMLTDRDEIFEEQTAIERGANYWVTKSQRQLLLTYMKAALSDFDKEKIEFENLRIDFDKMIIEVKRETEWVQVNLTPRERKLLFFLVYRKDKLQTNDKLKTRVFDVLKHLDEHTDRLKKQQILRNFTGLDKTVSTLRGKIEIDSKDPKYIVNRRTEGYYFESDA